MSYQPSLTLQMMRDTGVTEVVKTNGSQALCTQSSDLSRALFSGTLNPPACLPSLVRDRGE